MELDLHLFRQASIDENLGAIVWPNGADIEPGVWHDWPHQMDAIPLARSWRAAGGHCTNSVQQKHQEDCATILALPGYEQSRHRPTVAHRADRQFGHSRVVEDRRKCSLCKFW